MERITYQELPAGLLQGMLLSEKFIGQSGLSQKLLELVRFRVSQINSCAYCLDMHYKEALHAGEEPIRLLSVSAWRETSYYSEPEKAALAFAEALTHMPPEAESDHLHKDLLLHFSKKEIAILSLAIAQINGWNRLMRSFGREAGHYQVPSSSPAAA